MVAFYKIFVVILLYFGALNSLSQSSLLTTSYEVKNIPRKGYGCVAKRDINIGECIIEEVPLILVSNAKSWFTPSESYALSKLENALSKVTVEHQREYYELHAFSRPGHAHERTLDIFRTNAYPAGPNAAGIFPKISRINSDCNPNVHYNWNPIRNASTIYAIKPIKANTEILNCYIGLFLPQQVRMDYLEKNFGFRCNCRTCSFTGQERARSDYRRKKLQLLEDVCKYPMKLDASHSLAEFQLTGREKLSDIILERFRLLEEEEIATPSTILKCLLDIFIKTSDGSFFPIEEMASRGGISALNPIECANRLSNYALDAYSNAILSKGSLSKEISQCKSLLKLLANDQIQ